MRDELKAYLDKDNLIINLRTSNEKGSHWILCSKKYNIYFDSYGVVPIKEIDKYLVDDCKYNTLQVQQINSKICRQLCCFVLFSLEREKMFEEIILSLC